MSPVWAAPGDICDMQAHMADPTIHFHHCAEDGYAEDYELEDHVKLCLKKEEVDWLWSHGKHGEEAENGHCQTKEGEPHLGPEGLLVCNGVPEQLGLHGLNIHVTEPQLPGDPQRRLWA